MSGLRRELVWGLGVSALAAAGAIAWPQSSAVVDVTHRTEEPIASATASQYLAPARALPDASTLPEHLPSADLEPADFDPFKGVQPAPPPEAPKPKPLVGPLFTPPPPPTPVSYHYLGQMTDPTGARRVYLARNGTDKELVATVGTRLEDGYSVKSIDDVGVHLLYPPDAEALIRFPASP